MIKDLQWFEALVIPVLLIAGNFWVWFLHKHPLHRRWKIMPFAYDIHTKAHHFFFTDEDVVFRDSRDFQILLFPYWSVALYCFILGPGVAFIVSLFATKNISFLVLIGVPGYFLLYEIFHFISHLPEDHPVLKISHFRYMREHHRLHHRHSLMAGYNFTIVFPLADKVMGTFYPHEK